METILHVGCQHSDIFALVRNIPRKLMYTKPIFCLSLWLHPVVLYCIVWYAKIKEIFYNGQLNVMSCDTWPLCIQNSELNNYQSQPSNPNLSSNRKAPHWYKIWDTFPVLDFTAFIMQYISLASSFHIRDAHGWCIQNTYGIPAYLGFYITFAYCTVNTMSLSLFLACAQLGCHHITCQNKPTCRDTYFNYSTAVAEIFCFSLQNNSS